MIENHNDFGHKHNFFTVALNIFLFVSIPVKACSINNISSTITDTTVVLYPTDTIYGLGGFVTPEVVKKITTIKQPPTEKHYSIIAPTFQWIETYFSVKENIETLRTKYYDQFPGRGLTLLLPLADSRPDDIDFSLLTNAPSIGVRFLRHPFQQIVTQLGKPFITTSANISGQPNITHPDQLFDEQKQLIDYFIDAGTLDRPASVIIDYTSGEIIRG